MERELTPYKDANGAYINYVQDSKTKDLRGITETEADIVDFCFSPNHHFNRACAELGYRKFERVLRDKGFRGSCLCEVATNNPQACLWAESRLLKHNSCK